MATWDECVKKEGMLHGGGHIPEGVRFWIVKSHDGRVLLRITLGADVVKLAGFRDRDRIHIRFNWQDRIGLIERTNDASGFTLGRHGRTKRSVTENRDHSLSASVNTKYLSELAREFMNKWLNGNIVRPSFHMASDGIRFSLAPSEAVTERR